LWITSDSSEGKQQMYYKLHVLYMADSREENNDRLVRQYP
jgi:hypothetical protein